MEAQGYDISPTRAIIPHIQTLLSAFRHHNYPVYHTREGHRPDLSTLSSRELHRSRNNPTGMGIGDPGPLGRLLIRGEGGHDTIPEVYPLASEPVIDKPGRGAFAHTDFELLLKLKGVRNLVICGVTTDVCVSSTMREANDRGFDCVLVEDATAAAEESLKIGICDGIKEEGGIFGAVCRTEGIVEGIRAVSGDLDGFREEMNGESEKSTIRLEDEE